MKKLLLAFVILLSTTAANALTTWTGCVWGHYVVADAYQDAAGRWHVVSFATGGPCVGTYIRPVRMLAHAIIPEGVAPDAGTEVAINNLREGDFHATTGSDFDVAIDDAVNGGSDSYIIVDLSHLTPEMQKHFSN